MRAELPVLGLEKGQVAANIEKTSAVAGAIEGGKLTEGHLDDRGRFVPGPAPAADSSLDELTGHGLTVDDLDHDEYDPDDE